MAEFGKRLGGKEREWVMLLLQQNDNGFDDDDSRRQLFPLSTSQTSFGSWARLLPLIEIYTTCQILSLSNLHYVFSRFNSFLSFNIKNNVKANPLRFLPSFFPTHTFIFHLLSDNS